MNRSSQFFVREENEELGTRLAALDARIASASFVDRGYERLLRERRITARLLAAARIDRLLASGPRSREG